MPTLAVCASNATVRAGLASMAASPTTSLIGRLDSLPALSRWLQTEAVNEVIDLVLIDLCAPAEDINQLAQIVDSSEAESIPLLLLVDSELIDDTFAQRVQAQLLSSGLVSIVPATVSTSELEAAIAAVTQGLLVLHPEIAELLFDPVGLPYPQRESDIAPSIEPLTTRETEVLNQLASGLTNKAIAQNLNISEHTVKFHLSTVLSKLDASSRTEAVTIGIRAGLVIL